MSGLFWLFFWLLYWPVHWLTEIDSVLVKLPLWVYGILYVLCVTGFFYFLLWLDRRGEGVGISRRMKISWMLLTPLIAIGVFLLLYGIGGTRWDFVRGCYALLLPILGSCVWFLVGFLRE